MSVQPTSVVTSHHYAGIQSRAKSILPRQQVSFLPNGSAITHSRASIQHIHDHSKSYPRLHGTRHYYFSLSQTTVGYVIAYFFFKEQWDGGLSTKVINIAALHNIL